MYLLDTHQCRHIFPIQEEEAGGLIGYLPILSYICALWSGNLALAHLSPSPDLAHRQLCTELACVIAQMYSFARQIAKQL